MTRVLPAVGLALLAAGEAVVVQGYVVRGTTWHLLLHSLIGLGLGLAAGAVAASLSSRPWARGPVRWAAAGQLVSIVPDLLFVLGRLPHARWMDAFVGHVTIHVAPAPLPVALGVFLLGSTAWYLAAVALRPLPARLLSVATAGVLGLALALARPLPTGLGDFRDGTGALAGWLC